MENHGHQTVRIKVQASTQEYSAMSNQVQGQHEDWLREPSQEVTPHHSALSAGPTQNVRPAQDVGPDKLSLTAASGN